MIDIQVYTPDRFDDVEALWRQVFPDDPPYSAAAPVIAAKAAVHPELFLIAVADGHLAGTVLAGWDGHRGWLYKLAVAPAHRDRGIGAALVRAAEARLAALGCAKVNLQVRAGNPAAGFWQRLGYGEEPRISFGKRIA
ncbi:MULTISPECIES: GNAT family acetyltransferase [unclassified Sphingomonas]|uniref:GNAT family acetyltransferase n=1 Tax=unclassified Sphingomonas TaxID=196159 RepID=UPI0008299D45|nr:MULTISPECIES: GNAT family acetyltransferase [unclassified Sphingomonas]